MGHELYCAGHLFQAGVAFARTTGDTTLLTVARRFADLIDEVFVQGTDTPHRRTSRGRGRARRALPADGRESLPELADTLISRRGFGMFAGGRFDLDYYQDAEPVREARSIVGHAVRALYLAAGVTDIYAETGDKALLESMLRQWDDLTAAKTYLTGGIGSRHHGEAIGDPYELPPDRAYCETCAAIASIMWNWRMLLVTGESRFADLLERTLYNGFLSGLSLDGESFFYMNPLQSRNGERRHRWNPVACCPPNVMRLLASLHHYLATVTETGIQLHQYASSTIRTVVPGGRSGRAHRRDELPVVGHGRGRGRLDHRCRVDAVAPDPGVGPRRDRRRRAGRAGQYAQLTRRWQAGDRVTWRSTSRRGSPPRIRASTPFASASRSSVAPSSTASSSMIFRPARIWPTSPRPCGRPRRQRPGRAARRPARRGARGRPPQHDGWRQTEYRDLRELPATSAAPTQLLAVPYFAWANRDEGGMRVWIPDGGLGARRRPWRPCRSSR